MIAKLRAEELHCTTRIELANLGLNFPLVKSILLPVSTLSTAVVVVVVSLSIQLNPRAQNVSRP